MFSVALSVERSSYASLGALPDVIRHTALRSSDFPLPTPKRGKRPSGPAAYKSIIYGWKHALCAPAAPPSELRFLHPSQSQAGKLKPHRQSPSDRN